MKLRSEDKLMEKFFLKSLKDDTNQWFYNLLEGLIDLFKLLVKVFMNQHKYNIKEQDIVIKLCNLSQGPIEILKKYISRFKKVWNSIHSKLDEVKIYGIFIDFIILVIKLHALDYTELGFAIIIEIILTK